MLDFLPGPSRPVVCWLGLVLAAPLLHAQVNPPAPPAGPTAPEPGAAEAPVQRVQITGGRETDTEQRRRSTAAKIIVGRDEIEKYGDSSVGELLKRLPGVTVQGNAGRGGQIRMRGLGNGYTQILLDGERVQGGLSLDSLDPDQIERIEIIRAPTAETGARAIGGTINIITRDGFVRRLNDVRVGLNVDQGGPGGHASWNREDKLDATTEYNLSLSAFASRNRNDSEVTTTNPTEERTEIITSPNHRMGFHLGNRWRWRLEDGSSWMLNPTLFHVHNSTERRSRFAPGALGELPYQSSLSDTQSRYSLGRLNAQNQQRLGHGRLEWRAGVGRGQNHSRTLRDEWDADSLLLHHYDDEVHATEDTHSLSAKYTLLTAAEHSLVTGAELENGQREERRDARIDAVAQGGAFGDNLQARSLRTALYAQDEWALSPQWATHVGLRWEGIHTEGSEVNGQQPSNQSSVWTPLLHAVWKPDPKSRDQLRISLTRAYKSPELAQLVGATWLSKGNNSATNPDRSGNPDLQPELSTGLDLAAERYLGGGGMLSASLFARRIRDLIRTEVSQQTQADGSLRWVAWPVNVGPAWTHGLELEAKFRLTEWDESAPPVDVRANLSVFRSSVDAVPGPDNRLDQQPPGTANLGADYRLRSLALTVGGSLNWTPAYRTQLAADESSRSDVKRVVDVYALWQQQPDMRWRVSVGNLAPLSSTNSSTLGDETKRTFSPSDAVLRVQLEMKI